MLSRVQFNILGPGLRAVVFVAPAISLDDQLQPAGSARRPSLVSFPDERDRPEPSVASMKPSNNDVLRVPGDTLAAWSSARDVAARQGVPCLLLLTKCDLLAEVPLPDGMSPTAVELALRSQFFAAVRGPRPSAAPATAEAKDAEPSTWRGLFGAATTVPAAAEGDATGAALGKEVDESSRGVNTLGDTETHSVATVTTFVMQRAFPGIETEDEPRGLDEVTHERRLPAPR